MTSLRIGAALLMALSGCSGSFDLDADAPAAETVNVIDASSLNDLMLTVSDPEDAVAYFQRALAEEPDRVDFRRGYALALARARRFDAAAAEFAALAEDGIMDDQTRIEYAHSLARLQRWPDAEQVMTGVSAAADGPRRHLIDALLADQRSDWAAADAAYEKARKAASNPAAILNNWGVSRLSRGQLKEAARTFEQALTYDPRLFNAKNNLAVSRALQGEYRMPLVTVTDEERAMLLHNIGVIALRRGDLAQAKGLFAMAVAAHPRHYPEAAEKLAALNANIMN